MYRADGVYSFHLASAVDEAELGITDIVRGSDLLESSARQIYVMSMLHRPAPRYVHLPVAIDTTGAKLSKQSGAKPVDGARPVATLCAVMRFLNQPIPPNSSAPRSNNSGHMPSSAGISIALAHVAARRRRR